MIKKKRAKHFVWYKKKKRTYKKNREVVFFLKKNDGEVLKEDANDGHSWVR